MKSLVSISVRRQKRKHVIAVWCIESSSTVFWSLYISLCRISQQLTTWTNYWPTVFILCSNGDIKGLFLKNILTDFICLKGNLLGIEQSRWNTVISKFFITTHSTYCSIRTKKQISYWIFFFFFSRNGLQYDWISERGNLKKYVNQNNTKLPTMFSWVWVSTCETIWGMESAFLFSIRKRNV